MLNAYNNIHVVALLGGQRTRNLQVTGYECWPGTITQWSRASYLHLCASVTKQYNLVPAKGGDLFGLVESNGSLLLGLRLMSPVG